MKILAFSDIHGDSSRAKKLAEKAEKNNVDAVVICGDITFFDEDVEGIIGPFLKKGKEVIFVPGNHDSPATVDFLTKKYKIKNLHSSSEVVDDVGLFGSGWTTNVGPVAINESEMKKYLKTGFEEIKDLEKRIMVTHIHPKGSKIEKKFKFEGSSSVTKMIYELQPDLHLCGHIHEAEGMEQKMGKTRVISLGKKGKIINLG